MVKRPVHTEPHTDPAETEKTVDRRRQATLIGVGAGVVLLAWFAFANLNDVRIDFWLIHRQAPLIVVIVISGLLGALITALVMRRRTKAPRE
ncbi:MAG TPA: LapA family protein [Acidimicrobiales bacterium]|nr:LapA family protein [Acidimicrobiales bacterium]